MIFKSSKGEKTDKETYQIIGDLTIRGITKIIVFDAKHSGTITSFGSQRMGRQATATINRFDFGLHWDKTMDTGGLIVGEMIRININTELVEQD